MLCAVGRQTLFDSRVEQGDVGVELFEAADLKAEQKAVVLLDPALKGQFQLGELLAERTLGKLRHLFRGRLADDQSAQHEHARGPEDVARDAGQLDIGALEQLEETVLLRSPALNQLPAIAKEVSKLTDGLGWHEALRDQAVPEQIRDPLAVLDVGLAAGDVLDVVSIAYRDVEGILQDGIHRLPVDARALHRHVGTSFGEKPVLESQQLACDRTKRADDLARLLVRLARQKAGRDRRLAHVDAAAPLDDRIHRSASSAGDRCAAPSGRNCYACFPLPGATNGGASAQRWSVLRTGSGPPKGRATFERP